MKEFFNESQKEFLKNYQPAHRMFTTFEEALKISEALNFGDDVDYRKLRDEVVSFYFDLEEEGVDFGKAMSSVTMVIDSKINGYWETLEEEYLKECNKKK